MAGEQSVVATVFSLWLMCSAGHNACKIVSFDTCRDGSQSVSTCEPYNAEPRDDIAAADRTPQCPDNPRDWAHMWLACYDYTHKQDPKLWEPRK